MRCGDLVKMSRTLRLSYQYGIQAKYVNANFANQIVRRHYASEPKKESEPIRSKITSAYVNHLDKIENKFKTKWPKAHKLFRLFKDGLADFFKDSKEFYKITMQIRSGTPLSFFECRQLQLYQTMPSDLLKSVPIILSIPIPLATYIIFPIAYYMYPQYLLCSHFWTEEQKKIFAVEDFEFRLDHYLKVYENLEGHLSYIRNLETRNEFQNLLMKVKLGNGTVEPEEILKFKDLFTTLPYGIDHLMDRKKIYMRHLSKSLNVSTSKSKVMHDLKVIANIDSTLSESGFDCVKKETLYQIGLMRGINPYEVSEEELKNYLKKWMKVSKNVDESSYSLLLHAPIFLSPNWMKKLQIPQSRI